MGSASENHLAKWWAVWIFPKIVADGYSESGARLRRVDFSKKAKSSIGHLSVDEDDKAEGKPVGVDCCGNTYYENPYYMIGRSRWVIYNPAVKFEYDASQVSAEWAGWLHYRTDCKPNEDYAKICFMCCPFVRSWLLPHMENLSGSDQAYYPYSTTRAYIHVWNGKSSCHREETSEPTTSLDGPCDPCKK